MIEPCPEDMLPAHDPSLAAQWMWVALIVAVVAFELWALHSRNNTLSQFVQHRPRWFRWLAVGAVTVLGLHLLGVL